MKIDQMILGAYETNCFILRAQASAKDCLIIDIGLEAGEMVRFLEKQKLNPVAVVLTHGHIDHIGGLAELKQKYPAVRVYIHRLDEKMLTEPARNLSALAGIEYTTDQPDITVENGQIIEDAGLKLKVLHTPGHTPGGISLYMEEEGVVFTGDALFADSVGRTDFPGGSIAQLVKGIKEKLCTLPDETIVYPGHGPQTTIGREKRYNQYLQ